MKKIVILITILSISMTIFGVEILVPKAPPAIPLIKMDADYKLFSNVTVQVLPKIIKNEELFFIIPTNVGAKLYNKGQDIKLIGIVSGGLLSLISQDKLVGDIKDLKEVYIGAKGSSPDVISKTIFRNLAISPTIIYSSSVQIAKLFLAGKISSCILPEPLATAVLSQKGRRICQLRDYWEDAIIPQTALFTKGTKVSKKFIKDYKRAVTWVNKNPKEAAEMSKTVLESKNVDVIAKSISKMNLIFIDGSKAKKLVNEYLEELYKQDKKSVGGVIPDENFFSE